jgi:hypothetical protein
MSEEQSESKVRWLGHEGIEKGKLSSAPPEFIGGEN